MDYIVLFDVTIEDRRESYQRQLGSRGKPADSSYCIPHRPIVALMDYVVLFDVSTKPRSWVGWPSLIILVVFTLFLIWRERERDPYDDFLKRNVARIIVAVVLISMASTIGLYETRRWRWIAQLASGHGSVVEGKISDVTVRGVSGKTPSVETCFTVESERFCFNSRQSTPATTSRAPVRPDLWVRVSYLPDGKPILRLEARRDSLDRLNDPVE